MIAVVECLCHNVAMKKNLKIIWKFYAIIFGFISTANLIWLFYSDSEPYIFYHILITWSNFFLPHYVLAIVKSVLNIFCLYPLFAFSFNKESSHHNFWKWLLIIRFFLELFGNYYEFVFVKASYYMVLGYGLSVTGAVILPLIPSYIAHFSYCFPNKKSS